MQQNMVREIRKPAEISLGEQFGAADRKEILMHEQFPVQTIIDFERVADSNIDPFAGEIDGERGRLQGDVELRKPLGEPAKTRNEPTRNE